jgi:hypothetical protein
MGEEVCMVGQNAFVFSPAQMAHALEVFLNRHLLDIEERPVTVLSVRYEEDRKQFVIVTEGKG